MTNNTKSPKITADHRSHPLAKHNRTKIRQQATLTSGEVPPTSTSWILILITNYTISPKNRQQTTLTSGEVPPAGNIHTYYINYDD